jgi:hypothetical protein
LPHLAFLDRKRSLALLEVAGRWFVVAKLGLIDCHFLLALENEPRRSKGKSDTKLARPSVGVHANGAGKHLVQRRWQKDALHDTIYASVYY